jgi:hypothetical protein
MARVVVRRESGVVVLVVNGQRAAELGVDTARAVCDALRPHVRGEGADETSVGQGVHQLEFRTQPKLADEGENMVLCIAGGRLLFDAPVSVASRIWSALCAQQRQLEEEQPVNAERIAFDGGLLLRTGAPFGLTDNSKLQQEVVKEAGHNRDLRRFLPGGVRGQVLAAPRIYHDSRSPEDRIRMLARTSPQAHRRLLAALH